MHPLIFFLSNATVTLLGVCLDVVACALIISSREPRYRCLLIAWLGLLFITFHLGIYLLGEQRPCGCFGRSDMLEHVFRVKEDILAVAAALCMMGGGLLSYAIARFGGRPDTVGTGQHNHATLST